MLWLVIACTSAEESGETGTRPLDTGSTDSGGETGDSGGETGDTAVDTGDTGRPALFDEPFESLDATRWTAADWMLGESQLVSKNAKLRAKGVDLVHSGREGAWLGTELYTSETFSAGHWTATIRPPEASGSVCAFFFYGENAGVVNEIDVELVAGNVWFSVYRNWTEADGYDDGPNHLHRVWSPPADFDPTVAHTFGLDWGVDRLDFTVDSAPAATLDLVPAEAIAVHINHWTSKTWPEVAYPPPAEVVCRIEGILAFD